MGDFSFHHVWVSGNDNQNENHIKWDTSSVILLPSIMVASVVESLHGGCNVQKMESVIPFNVV